MGGGGKRGGRGEPRAHAAVVWMRVVVVVVWGWRCFGGGGG